MSPRCRFLVLGALALLAPLMAACTPDTPETELSWNANDHVGPRHREPDVQYAQRDTTKTYVYQGDSYAVPAPKPRPEPPAYQPPVYHPVAEEPVYDRSQGGAFDWPLKGRVISGFGTTHNGERNDGINIAAPAGTPIRAAASGTVTYSGDELKDYGNLILLKHSGGYVTAYAHADRLIVSRGETVRQGQVIGYTGSTGDVSSPQLHFEIRRDTTPLDPRNLLVARNS
jgi:murein DD-endopeptidase MepM/ murein hydrolase activator NlpD